MSTSSDSRRPSVSASVDVKNAVERCIELVMASSMGKHCEKCSHIACSTARSIRSHIEVEFSKVLIGVDLPEIAAAAKSQLATAGKRELAELEDISGDLFVGLHAARRWIDNCSGVPSTSPGKIAILARCDAALTGSALSAPTAAATEPKAGPQ